MPKPDFEAQTISLDQLDVRALTGGLAYRLRKPTTNPDEDQEREHSDPLALHVQDPSSIQNNDIIEALGNKDLSRESESNVAQAIQDCSEIFPRLNASGFRTPEMSAFNNAFIIFWGRLYERKNHDAWEAGRNVGRGEGINEAYKSARNGY